MTTTAQKKAQQRYDKRRNGPISIRLTQSQRQWISERLLPNEGFSSCIKRLAGIPSGE